jgi:small subunit ribosomal protein S6
VSASRWSPNDDRGAATAYCRVSGPQPPHATALLPRIDRGRLSPKEVETALRTYEVMVILDPSLDERTVAPSLDTYLNVVRQDGGEVESVDVWGKRRLAYEIDKNAEGIYAVVDLKADPATVKELDRQLSLNESVLRTKVIRPDVR